MRETTKENVLEAVTSDLRLKGWLKIIQEKRDWELLCLQSQQ
jgi:hypothetical protein